MGTGVSCATQRYSEEDMTRMATVVRTTMSIIKGVYFGEDIPEEISEDELINIILTQNSPHFKELGIFHSYIEIKIISNTKDIGAVVWDSRTHRKIMQDLECTLKLDDATWKGEEFDDSFTLDWGICSSE